MSDTNTNADANEMVAEQKERYRLEGYLLFMANCSSNKIFGLSMMLGEHFKNVPDDYEPDGRYDDVEGTDQDCGLFYIPGKNDLQLRERLKSEKDDSK
jgi:hypothetical protein